MRRTVLLALPLAAGAALAVFGPGAPVPAAAEPDAVHVDKDLGYRCGFPTGEQPVDVRVTATVPATGDAGAPVQPADAAVTVSLRGAALTDLTGTGATAAGAVVRLETAISRHDETAAATWSGARTDPVPVPDGEDPVLALDVPLETPPPVVARAAGDLVVAAGDLTVVLTGYTADGTVTEPPSIEVSCVLAPDQAADLAVVQVSDVDAPSSSAAPPPGAVTVAPGTGTRSAPTATEVEIPADCHAIDPPTPSNNRYCAYVTGYANVTKLHAAVLQPPGIVNIGPTNFRPGCVPGTPILCQQANLLANNGDEPVLPGAPASMLPFGFVPAKATMQLTQVGIGFADVKLHPIDSSQSSATVTGTFLARLSEASVVGVPLDLGPNCRTRTPIDVVLHGKPPEYLLTGGGPLDGMITIPPFTGCGTNGVLDPLITGLVSGPANYVKLTQGPICTITGNHFGCPPAVPTPQT